MGKVIQSEAVMKNELTEAEQAAALDPTNPGAEPAVQAAENERSYARTRQGRIAGYEKKIAEMQAKLEALRNSPDVAPRAQRATPNVHVGDHHAFEYGRGAGKTVLTGQVLAVFDKNGSRKVKFLTGEGADAQVLEVFAHSVQTTDEVAADPLTIEV